MSKEEAVITVTSYSGPSYRLSHARHDPIHCLTPGLFQSLSKNCRKTEGFEAVHDYGNGRRIEFYGPKRLGAEDLRVLQGLVAMAGPSGQVLSIRPSTKEGKHLRQSLNIEEEITEEDAIVVDDSYRALAREIGYSEDGGSQFKTIRECLERLWMVCVIAQHNGKRQGFHLLATYSSDESNGKLCVALNPMIARAVMGGGRYVHISMKEIRSLKSDAARLIHQRLCAWVDPKKSAKVSLDIMASYVWHKKVNATAMRKRRQRTREALDEIRSTGWVFTEYVHSKYEVIRPDVSSGQ